MTAYDFKIQSSTPGTHVTWLKLVVSNAWKDHLSGVLSNPLLNTETA